MPWIRMEYERKHFKGKGRLTTFVTNKKDLQDKLERFEVGQIIELEVDGKITTLEKVFTS